MAGETEEKPSGLTVDTLKILLDARLAEADRRYEQRFYSQQQAVEAAFYAAKEATTKAENASERRFESINEFRAQLADQAATLVTRNEVNARFDAIGEKVSDLADRVNRSGGRAAGVTDARGLTIAAIGLLIGLSAVAVSIVVAISR